MNFDNPFQLNDWKIKKFLKIIFTIQIAMLSTIGMDAIGLEIPIIRQMIGFIYLTFVPGVCILRILKLHRLGIETPLYTVGLSIAFLMFTGLFINTFYPYFGIFRPLSLIPLLITIIAIVLLLSILCYMRDKDFSDSCRVNLGDILSPSVLILFLLPILSIVGVYLARLYHNGIIIFILIILIVLLMILATFDKFIKKKLFPLFIFVISISLLFHRSLFSPYLFGTDIMVESYIYNIVDINSLWISSIPESVNAMMSVTILPVIYSKFLMMDITWIFKIIYPLIFSFVPLGLYCIYKNQTDEKTSLISAFFFVSFGGFFTTMLYLARQQIAELFIVLIILLIIKKERSVGRSILIILFSSSLIVSHYASSYIFGFILITSWCLLHLKRYKETNLNMTYIMLFIVIILSWYIFISSSAVFYSVVNIGNFMFQNIYTDMFNVDTRGSDVSKVIGVASTESFVHDIGRYVFLVTFLFIVVGYLVTILNRKNTKINPDYISLSTINLVILIFSVIVPNFVVNLNMDRMYIITLIVLSPFFTLGGEAIFKATLRLFKPVSSNNPYYVRILVLFVLISYFLYNIGFIYEVTGDRPTSLPLSMYRMENSENVNVKSAFYAQYTSEQDVDGVKWLSSNIHNKAKIYADEGRRFEVIGYIFGSNSERADYMNPVDRVLRLKSTTSHILITYLYLGSANTKGDIIEYWRPENTISNINEIQQLLEKKSKIYSNGGSEIWN